MTDRQQQAIAACEAHLKCLNKRQGAQVARLNRAQMEIDSAHYELDKIRREFVTARKSLQNAKEGP